MVEKLNVKSSLDFQTLLQQLTRTVLHMVESNSPSLLTPSDVLYLSQMIEMDRTALGSTPSVGVDATEITISVATNYMKLASFLLEPHMATQWMGSTEDGVRGLFICAVCN